MNIASSQWLRRIRHDSSIAFLFLFALDAASRALLITIVPQQAYQLLGSVQSVALVYLCAGVGGLAASLAVPMALARWSRREVATFSVLTSGLCCALLAGGRADGLVGAVLLQTIASSSIEIVINLYLLENVARRELNKFEPLRLLLAGVCFVVGPWLGVALDHRVTEGLTYVGVGLLLAIYLFLFLLLTADSGGLRRTNSVAASAINPLGYIRRYAGRPRLVLAWILAVGRSGWWLMYFVYTPIIVTRFGYDPEVGGLLVSLGQLPMLAIGLWAMLGRRYGLRRLLFWGYGGCAVATLAIGTTMGLPIICMACICLAALFATMIDGAGNVPFLRAVGPLERGEMTAVYMTYRHVGSLAPSAIYFAVLTVAPLSFVYFAGGLVALVMSGLSLYLPRRL